MTFPSSAAIDGKLFVFGGLLRNDQPCAGELNGTAFHWSTVNDLWELDLSFLTWNRLRAQGNPPATTLSTLTSLEFPLHRGGGTVLLSFGGMQWDCFWNGPPTCTEPSVLDELWMLDVSPTPSERALQGDKMLLFGLCHPRPGAGLNSSNCCCHANDWRPAVWRFSGSQVLGS